MPAPHPDLARAQAFCAAYDLRIPILMAPMAGACPTSLAIAIANAGGLGACGALVMEPATIKSWASEVRAGSNGGFQVNQWIPDPALARDAAAEDAVRAGADVIVAQGMEAGGHRGAFDAASAEATMVGSFALLPAVVDAVKVPVVATGGIADARGVAAALILGAAAVQVGTGFLRCPEAKLAPA